MKPRSFLARTALAALLTAGAVLAQAQAQTAPSAEQVAQRLAQADANHDGYLDRSEVADMPRLKRGFDRIDTDKDGRLSRAELQAVGQQLKQRQAGQ
ncbi:EF hand [Pseudoxanthomonas sp. GM95]|uniref:EF-hand domain-containing protein n=1 Tax=Pseudoxanthomonas sp. GM95 TaxID=1881043 RepID=UPI0008D11C73|nr:EF-hand domain-containing protein [Pseudoxanthomonas sp. GM95]SEM47436.1 EF hand [Pseudoxanthomonas sp. GM95]